MRDLHPTQHRSIFTTVPTISNFSGELKHPRIKELSVRTEANVVQHVRHGCHLCRCARTRNTDNIECRQLQNQCTPFDVVKQLTGTVPRQRLRPLSRLCLPNTMTTHSVCAGLQCYGLPSLPAGSTPLPTYPPTHLKHHRSPKPFMHTRYPNQQ